MTTRTTNPFFFHTLIGVFFCWALFATACNKTTVLNELQETPQPVWPAQTPLIFHAAVVDTTPAYNLFFSLRHHIDYPWMNSFFYIESICPDSTVVRDTIECIMAEPDGKWKGQGIGKNKNIQYLYKTNFQFNRLGDYTFKIYHAMRIDSLSSINHVGLKINRISK